jgi:hypothetical protein
MRAIKSITIAISLTFIVILSTGCPGMYTRSGNFPNHLLVYYSGDTLGELFPCGCQIPMGGLSRRGGLISQETPYPTLVLDTGSFARGNMGYDRFVAGWMMKAYREIGYTAVNLGTQETIQPVSQLREWDDLAGGILVSANLVDEHGLPVTRTHLIRDIGGIRIGITGVTATGYQRAASSEAPELLVPVSPLQEVMDTFREEGVDFPVLLADVSGEELQAIVEQVEGFRLIIQGEGFNKHSGVTILDNGARLVRIGDQGKYLGRLRLDFNSDGTNVGEEIENVPLDSTAPTLASITQTLTDFKIELRQRREEFLTDPPNPFRRAQSPMLIDVLSGYTGVAFCRDCHVGYDLGDTYRLHENAWGILDEAAQTNPECLECHTTGYGVPTGMEDPFRDTNMRGVTCEACHGPAAEHVRTQTAIKDGLDESQMLPLDDPTGIPFTREVPEEVCIRCHTPEWSPDFDYETWIERVRHVGANRPGSFTPEQAEE